MFNQLILKSFMGLSWLLVAYAASPYAPQSAAWLAGFALGATYALAGIVYGVTDQSMHREAVKHLDAARMAMDNAQLVVQELTRKTDDKINSVSVALSALRKEAGRL